MASVERGEFIILEVVFNYKAKGSMNAVMPCVPSRSWTRQKPLEAIQETGPNRTKLMDDLQSKQRRRKK
ncbi:hypothetical protein CN204_33990 [Sinorhizobium meliloti]|nr:hypothetical protein CN204_33990 [Sinorhizobium meliloti]RVM17714.1 hypothetical protein CN132_34940 [Sinorhizobium meliloti]